MFNHVISKVESLAGGAYLCTSKYVHRQGKGKPIIINVRGAEGGGAEYILA